MKDGDKIILLKHISINALMSTIPNQELKLETGEVKLIRYTLSQKINKGKEVELSVEEISLLKERIGLFYPPLLVGKSYEILDPK